MIRLEDVQDAFINAKIKAEEDVESAIRKFYRSEQEREGLMMFNSLPKAVQDELIRRRPKIREMIKEK